MLRTPEFDVHIHICDTGSGWEGRHLLLTDWLQHSAEDRKAYAALKTTLQAQDWETMNHYANAETALISDMMLRAEAWAVSTRWAP
jgi:GrpB-like predicted nucleotidyltransferase (UPF0157 family)